jgi:Predicted membrane protein
MFSLFKKKKLFSEEENKKIVEAIRNAEMQTSGEVRVFVENRCRFMDPLDRAREIFAKLNMQQTKDRNAVLVYVALKDRQLAIYGDSGIHEKTGQHFWTAAVNMIIQHFNRENYAEGISSSIAQIGEALRQHFPFDKDIDKNELPDEIIFGR